MRPNVGMDVHQAGASIVVLMSEKLYRLSLSNESDKLKIIGQGT